MQKFSAIYTRELRSYFQSVTAYVTISVFLVLSGYFFWSVFRYYNFLSFQFDKGQYSGEMLNLIDGVMRPLLGNLSIVLLLVMPLLTMRLLAEEKKQGTFELLLTYPVSDVAAIAGKFLAALTVFACMIAGTLLYPLLLFIFADPEPGPILAGYLGIMLVGCTFISIGIFFSSLTDNQLVAGVMTFGFALLILIIGWAAPYAEPPMSTIIEQLSLLEHSDSFSKGVIELKDLSYYIFMTGFFLFLTLKSLESTRWRS